MLDRVGNFVQPENLKTHNWNTNYVNKFVSRSKVEEQVTIIWSAKNAVVNAITGNKIDRANAREQFESHFTQLSKGILDDLEKNRLLTPEQAATKRNELGQSLADIQKDCLADKQTTSQADEADIREAHFREMTALYKVVGEAYEQEVAKAEERQLPPNIIQKSDGNFLLIRPAPKPSNMALPGGGGAGIGYGPTLAALDQGGMLDNIQHVGGTSAGSLAAMLYATGMSTDRLQTMISEEISPNELKNDIDNFAERYGDCVKMSRVSGYYSGQRALEIADERTYSTVQEYLSDNWGQDAALEQRLKDKLGERNGAQALDRLTTLRDRDFATEGSRKNFMITFADLGLLRAVDDSGRFKDLTLYGASSNREVVFDKNNTPNMPVAVAARASMSIPFYFKSVTYNDQTFTDGGVHVNQPAKRMAGPPEHTLVLAFDQQGKGYRSAHAFQKQAAGDGNESTLDRLKRQIGNGASAATGMLIGNPSAYQAWNSDVEAVHKAGPGVIFVFHGNTGLLSLNPTAAQKEYALTQANAETYLQLFHRVDQAVEMEFADINAAVENLTQEEIALIKNADKLNPNQKNDPVEDAFKRAVLKKYPDV